MRAVSGAVDRQPNLQSTSSASVHAFSAIKGARRDSSNKWLKAAQAVAGVDLEDNVGEPAQPLHFFVNGAEIHLSTSPVVPGHSIIQYKGKLSILLTAALVIASL